MKIIPFRREKRDERPKPSSIRFVRFHPARDLAEYGFDGAKPKKLEGSPSGFLLPWAGIDAERDRRVHGGPCQFVIEGEYVDEATGLRSPSLAINEDWMEERGYTRPMSVEKGRVVYGSWHKSA